MKKKTRKMLPFKLFIMLALLAATIIVIVIGEFATKPSGFKTQSGPAKNVEE